MTTIRNPFAAPGPRYGRESLVHRTPVVHVQAPSFRGTPSITGTAQVGETLTGVVPEYLGSDPVTLTYVWKDDGEVIDGADAITFECTASEEGGVITFEPTATNRKGSATATSAGTDAVLAAE